MLSDITLDAQCRLAHLGVAIVGRLKVDVEMICQRCLSPMRLEIDEPLDVLALSAAETELAAAEQDYIELNEDAEIETGNWLEDELLLHLPTFAMHSQIDECDPEVIKQVEQHKPVEESVKHNPFAVLKSLKDKR